MLFYTQGRVLLYVVFCSVLCWEYGDLGSLCYAGHTAIGQNLDKVNHILLKFAAQNDEYGKL